MSLIWSIDDFLSQYSSSNTRKIYYTAYKEYFKLIYPELEALPPNELRAQINKKSIEYLSSDKDHRKDLLAYKESIQNKAPKTITTKIVAILSYLQDNGIIIYLNVY
jgi:hypothetical protein